MEGKDEKEREPKETRVNAAVRKVRRKHLGGTPARGARSPKRDSLKGGRKGRREVPISDKQGRQVHEGDEAVAQTRRDKQGPWRLTRDHLEAAARSHRTERGQR